jgi:hypothetical protein
VSGPPWQTPTGDRSASRPGAPADAGKPERSDTFLDELRRAVGDADERPPEDEAMAKFFEQGGGPERRSDRFLEEGADDGGRGWFGRKNR